MASAMGYLQEVGGCYHEKAAFHPSNLENTSQHPIVSGCPSPTPFFRSHLSFPMAQQHGAPCTGSSGQRSHSTTRPQPAAKSRQPGPFLQRFSAKGYPTTTRKARKLKMHAVRDGPRVTAARCSVVGTTSRKRFGSLRKGCGYIGNLCTGMEMERMQSPLGLPTETSPS